MTGRGRKTNGPGPARKIAESCLEHDDRLPRLLPEETEPRFGTTVYQLSNISREEPDASLFQVPSDYTVVKGFQHMKHRVEVIVP